MVQTEPSESGRGALPTPSPKPQALDGFVGDSGATVELAAMHFDGTMSEGWHPHVFTVTAWQGLNPWRDTRALRTALTELLHTLAPIDGDGIRWLPKDLWTNEAIAKACFVLGNVVEVWVVRPECCVRLRQCS